MIKKVRSSAMAREECRSCKEEYAEDNLIVLSISKSELVVLGSVVAGLIFTLINHAHCLSMDLDLLGNTTRGLRVCIQHHHFMGPKEMATPHFEFNLAIGYSEGGFPNHIYRTGGGTFEDESQMEGIIHGWSSIMIWHLHLEARDLFLFWDWLLQKDLDVVIPLLVMGTHSNLDAESPRPGMKLFVIFVFGIFAWAYQAIRPPPPKMAPLLQHLE